MAHWVKNLTGNREDVVAQWVKDLALLWLWHRCSYSSDSIPSLATSICHEFGPKKTNKQTKNKTKKPH